MIADLLPRYYEVTGANPTYRVIRSFVIDGHEVAWMEFTGTVKYLDGTTGDSYSGNAVCCECDFTEDVGWTIYKGQLAKMGHPDRCPAREKVQQMRYSELQKEYRERFSCSTSELLTHVDEIVVDLKAKVRAGEFIEDGNGASFWGGYFYLQTLAAVLGIPVRHIWRIGDRLKAQKKISLEGAVVQDYCEPAAPTWEEFARMEENGFVGSISLPTHSQMPQVWQLQIIRPDGTLVYAEPVRLSLSYQPDFGPDAGDVQEAEAKLRELLIQAQSETQAP